MKTYKIFSNYILTGETVFSDLEAAKNKMKEYAREILDHLTDVDRRNNKRDFEIISVEEIDNDGEIISEESLDMIELF